MYDRAQDDLPRFNFKPSWTFGYLMALGTAALFFGVSFVAYSYGAVPPIVSGSIGVAFAICAGLSAIMLVLGGGGMASLPYFLIGAGLFYGMGTYFSVTVTRSSLFFTEGQQWQMLPQVNLVNALAIFCAVLSAGVICARRPKGAEDMPTMAQRLETMKVLLTPALALGLFVAGIQWITFPVIKNAMFASTISLLVSVPIFALFLSGSLWSESTRGQRATAVLLFFLVAIEGLLSASKLTTIMPILGFSFGLWIGERHRFFAVIMAALTIWLYIAMLSSFVPQIRGHVMYDPVNNSVTERALIISDIVSSLEERAVEATEKGTFARFSPTQFSAHFIASYDNNFPGDSLDNFLVVLVPRLLWPEKPIINPGQQFDTMWRDYEFMSSLAIGFPAEAYWNGGWHMVALVGLYIGLMVGWFSRKWFLFRRDGWVHGGVFFMSPLLVKSSIWVEANIVGAYIGGWVKYMLVILAIDYSIRAIIYLRKRFSEEFDDPLPVDMTPRAIGT